VKETSPVSTESQRNGWRYAPMEGYWDEALLPSGFPRRHWRRLAVAIGRMGFRQFSRHWQTSQQLIQDDGITYNVGSDPLGNERPWPMDPIPMVIPEDEWAQIERAVTQRAMLLNAVLLDLYGPQQLVRERHLPPALVFANPQFLRPCFGITPPGGVLLHTYAADLARSPDGHWWVISDSTQVPSGMGYTLENRLVSARTLPHVFSQCQVRQLGRFFDVRRDALLALAANYSSTPRIVVLTPGPHSETYFEHSFLAGYWGFPLVEGADLTVRANRVYLKTLAGLEPVDLILRRLDDSFCDPLELRGDSLLGVPGLLEAVRGRAVAVDNALGSGLVETPAHIAFLPGLCRQLLGQELFLPSVATWWCGLEEPRRYVLQHLDKLVIKPAFPRFGRHAEFPVSMDAAARKKLTGRIEAQPEEYVAQEQVALSTAPVRTDTGFAPRHAVLRVFAAWDGQSYTVMPGGLTRVSTEDTSLVVSLQLGGGSKDTWVLGSPEEASAVPHPPQISIDAYPTKGNLPSSVADNLFWLGRYAERVGANVRLVRALLPALSSEQDLGRAASLETALHLLVGLRYLPPEAAAASIGQQLRTVQRLLTDVAYDPSRTFSLGWNLKELRRVAWHLKERLSADTWRVLHQLETEFSRAAPVEANQRYVAQMNLLDGAIMTLSAFDGLLMENTTRGFGWRFLEIGRRMERALQMANLLRSGVAEAPVEIEPYLQILLQIADSSITYRTRYLSFLRTEFVLELLLVDESNPRSVGFQLATLLHQIDRLREHDEARRHLLSWSLATKALSGVRVAQMVELSRRDAGGRLGALEGLIEQLKTDLYDLSDALTADYLSHLKASRLTSSS
jgi:uncharacterized circularly permuted ATP-grasp superfamily protein/uncharacterized alpha-E superfamily protein